MQESTTTVTETATLRLDLEVVVRRQVLEAIRVIVEEELQSALGCGPYERLEVLERQLAEGDHHSEWPG